jgi:hypothetical protein
MKKMMRIVIMVCVGVLLGIPQGLFAALSCTVAASCSDTTLFKISSTTNGHAELASESNYTNYVCCSGVVGLGNACSGTYDTAYVPTSTQMLIGSDVFAASTVGGDTGSTVPTPSSSTTLQTAFRYLVWSDAQAIKDKVDLAKRLGVRGVAIFKIDGGEDPGLWNVLPKVR